jgi:hypothetical protein
MSPEPAERNDGGVGREVDATTSYTSPCSNAVATLLSEMAVLTRWLVLSKATLARAQERSHRVGQRQARFGLVSPICHRIFHQTGA